MPKTSTKGIENIAGLDLAYAVRCLIAAGKTSAAEVSRLAAERGERIKALQAELAQLKGGRAPAATTPAKPPKTAKTRKLAARPARSPKRTAAKATAKAATGKALLVTTRKDGRTFTVTQKVVDARRVQGQYLGYLAQLPAKEKDRFKTIAREKGVPVAIVEIKKRLGKA